MTTLADIAVMLKTARRHAGLSQEVLAQRAGVARSTVARMENLANGDMSVSVLVRLLDAAGVDLHSAPRGPRSLETFLNKHRRRPAGGEQNP
ncbi:helix-turn-helix domain-containing protein [Biostraticola tofi]|uniref:Helix-turn-helix protein n=1 Tax=Biostraticola tofi TaxID=466109 RepID=A0A4V2W4P0_9GAMM|nr:helix-turn-helix transcriptional regulator [Biostraticola tofi]TCV96649.1 helix-turn-helix protein [Biostraticola tofi]